MGWLPKDVQISLGAFGLYEEFNVGDRKLFPKFLHLVESNERGDNLNMLHDSVTDACIRAITRFLMLTEADVVDLSLIEQTILQMYDFDNYLRSCNLIEFDSSGKQLLKDKMLNLKSFPALDQEKCVEYFDIFPDLGEDRFMIFNGEERYLRYQIKFVEVLDRHINEIKELESINEIYARKKSLANCEFNEHLSLPDAKSDTMTTNGIIPPNKPTEVSVFAKVRARIVDLEHRQAIHERVLLHLEKQREHFHQRLEFKRFFNRGVIDFDGMGIKYPKFETPMGKQQNSIRHSAKLIRLVYKWKKLPLRNFIVKLLSEPVDSRIGAEGLLPRLRPNHVVGTKRWPALTAGGLLLTTGLGMLMKKWW